MNKKCLYIPLLVLVAQLNVRAQTLYQFGFSGTSSTTDASGKIVTWKIDNNTLLNEAAKMGGVTDTSGLALAYHVAGSDMGDTIEIINKTNGATLNTLIGLYFGESFGRMELPSRSKQQIKRIEYIYTDQNSHSLGSALLTDYFWFDKAGNTNAMAVLGNMQWLVTPNSLYTNVQVRSGSFYTTRPYKFN